MKYDIAGQLGTVGRAILRRPEAHEGAQGVTRTRAELDLAIQSTVRYVMGAAGHERVMLSSPRTWLAFMPTAAARPSSSTRP